MGGASYDGHCTITITFVPICRPNTNRFDFFAYFIFNCSLYNTLYNLWCV